MAKASYLLLLPAPSLLLLVMAVWVDVITIREMRLATGLSQRAFARWLQIPFQTYRPFDSGRRAVPHRLLQRAESLLGQHQRDTALLTIDTVVANTAFIRGRCEPQPETDDYMCLDTLGVRSADTAHESLRC